MAETIQAYGSKTVTIPASMKLAVFSEESIRLNRIVPRGGESLIALTTSGGEYVTDVFSSDVSTSVNIDAAGFKVYYDIGLDPRAAEPSFDRYGLGADTIVVNSMDDLPDAVNGVIELTPNKLYSFRNTGITTANRFTCNGNLFIDGLYQNGPSQIVYTGSDTLFTVTNGNFEPRLINITAASGTAFEVDNSGFGGAPALCSFFKVFVLACAKFGTVTEAFTTFVDCGSFITGDGVTVNNTTAANAGFSMRQFGFSSLQDGAIAIDISGSTLSVFELQDIINVHTAAGSSTGIKADNSNIASGVVASVTSCEYLGSVTPLDGIDIDSTRFIYRDNSGIDDTKAQSLTYMAGNATETTITVQNQYEQVAGTWTSGGVSQFTQGLTTTRITYEAEKSRTFDLSMSLAVIAAAGQPVCRAQLYKNGNPVTGASNTTTCDSTYNQTIFIPWVIIVDEDDYLEIFIRNESGTQNLTVVDAVLKLHEA